MKLFKSVDEKLKEIGFVKIKEDKYGVRYERKNSKYNFTQSVDILHKEDKYGVRYERKNSKYNFTQSVDILHKASGRHILQSYDNELMDQKKIGNTCVGLTGYEMKLFLKKMKQIGLYSK